jgi:Domain of unknown function (DUF4194)
MALTRDEALSVAVTTLMRGPVYAEEAPGVWTTLRSQSARITDFLKVLGMRVIVDDVDEYAYLRSEDELPDGMPRLHRRHKLGMRASVLLVLLRQRMTAAEAEEATPRLVVTREEMVEWMRLYHPAGTSDERIGADIPKLEDLGYLKRLRGSEGVFEARRIIKAQVSADYLTRFAADLLSAAAGTRDDGDKLDAREGDDDDDR